MPRLLITLVDSEQGSPQKSTPSTVNCEGGILYLASGSPLLRGEEDRGVRSVYIAGVSRAGSGVVGGGSSCSLSATASVGKSPGEGGVFFATFAVGPS